MYYENMSRQLQSRIKKRGNHIAAVECWKRAYHALGQLKKFRETKEELVGLRSEQVLDKGLLKMAQELAYEVQMNEQFVKDFYDQFGQVP